jgi:hypothetical protein
MSDLYHLYTPSDRADRLRSSQHGYVVEPDGTILALRQMQVHGAISCERNPEVRAYYDALDDDRKNRTMTAASTHAVERHGEIRISIFLGGWSMDWSRTVPVTPEQFAALDVLAATDGIEDRDEVMTGSGDGQWRHVRRRMAKPNWGFDEETATDPDEED